MRCFFEEWEAYWRRLFSVAHRGMGCCIRDPDPQMALTVNLPHLIGNIQWTRDDTWLWCFLGCKGRWSIMSHLIKSGQDKVKKGERKWFRLHWWLDVRQWQSIIQTIGQLQRLSTGSISSTRSQTSPDGQLWEFTRFYNCSEQTTRLFLWPEEEKCSWDARGCPVFLLHTVGEEMGYKFGPTF